MAKVSVLCVGADAKGLRKEVLEAAGFKVHMAAPRSAAAGKLADGHTDCVVVDCDIPPWTLVEVLGEIHHSDAPPPVIFLCSRDTLPPTVRNRGSACVLKIDGPDALVSTIRRVTDGRAR